MHRLRNTPADPPHSISNQCCAIPHHPRLSLSPFARGRRRAMPHRRAPRAPMQPRALGSQ